MARDKNVNGYAPWAVGYEEVLDKQEVNAEEGLSKNEVKQRRKKFGRNQLRSKSKKSAWSILLDQFKSLIIGLLIFAAIASFAFGEIIDGIAVVIVIVINSLIGFVTELRAIRSVEALREMTKVDARVLREGNSQQVPAAAIVPGDIVMVEGGAVVTADMRLIEASRLQANESALTGESEPVSKHTDKIAEEKPLAERDNMLFKGTAVTRGSGVGVVTSTGMETELGQISELVAEAEQEHTPLEKRLDKLGERLVWLTLGVILLVALAGVWRGRELLLMIETAVALAVAAVPEGLPIVATIALARGMRRMAEKNALINRLASVETLGGTNVICTDKTGTLTENQMTATEYLFASGEVSVSGEGLQMQGDFSQEGEKIDPQQDLALKQALRVSVLCSNAELRQRESEENEAIGEPIEVALLVAGAKAGLRREKLTEKFPEVREVAFDPEIKMMATVHEQEEKGYFVAVKGAPEAVLEASSHYLQAAAEPAQLSEEDTQNWLDENERLAAKGLRMLALAYKQVESSEADPYEDLTFIGLVALLDPPREDVRPAIQACKDAGIQVSMVTGDLAVTARNIAQAVGLVDDSQEVVLGKELRPPEELDQETRQRIVDAPILARVSPKQKLDLIAIHQENNSIVAMTGDGVNDAPALKKADIGIAMGVRGTQVAREAADMVLEDDAFSTIVLAVRQGRVIFKNIRRFVLYLISCNVSEILVVFLATIINLPLPIRPLQILYLNFVTDVFPALALGVSEGDPSVMEHPPRDPKEPVLMRRHWLTMGAYSIVITLSVLGAYGLARVWLAMEGAQAITISFLTLAFAQLWHVFNMRDRGSHFFKNDVFKNPFVWGAVVLSSLLLLIPVYVAPLAEILNLVNPGLSGWGLVIGMSLIPWALGQIYNSLSQD